MSSKILSRLARRLTAFHISDGLSCTSACMTQAGARGFAEHTAKAEFLKSPTSKPKWGETLIGEVMQAKADSGAATAALFYCRPKDTVFEAVKKMANANVGSIVVLKGEPTATDSVAGIITERDYMRNVVVAGKSSKDMSCSELMTPREKLFTLTSHSTMLEAMNQMEELNIRHIPIIDDGTLRGMLSIKDVVGTLVNEHNAEVESMAEYIGGSY